MKQNQHTIPLGTTTTLKDIVHWEQALRRLHARIAPRFARPEPRRRALLYLQGVMSHVGAKMAGNWPNMPEKPLPMGCNVCSLRRLGCRSGA